MAVLLFFSMALFIFLASMTLTAVTFYHWYKTAKTNKALAASENAGSAKA